jgi:phosphatidylglycerophosphate synthase
MLLAPARLSPDLLSWIGTAFGICAAVLVAIGSGLVGGLVAHASSVVDGMDGEAARLQMRASPPGAVLDGALDRVADAAILGGLGLWALDATVVAPKVILALALAATFGSVMSMASKDRITANGLPSANERALSWLLGGRDGRLFLVTVFAIAGLPIAALIAITSTSLLTLFVRIRAVRRVPL